MFKRRDFLKTTGAAAFGTLMLSESNAAFFEMPAQHAVGLQLFTFFGVIDADVPGTLKKIAAIGYKEIESAYSLKGGYYGMKPKEFAKTVSDLGMTWKSQHVLGQVSASAGWSRYYEGRCRVSWQRSWERNR